MAWLQKLREDYKVENVFEGTEMEAHAEKLKFGLYVIRCFYSQKDAAPLMDDLSKSFDKLSDHWGEHSVRLGGNKKRWYDTIQLLLGECTCRYGYEGTGRNKIWREKDVPCLADLSKWLQGHMKRTPWNQFHQIVANRYSAERQEATPWHTDMNELLGPSTEVLCLSLGRPGLYCYKADDKTCLKALELLSSRGCQ